MTLKTVTSANGATISYRQLGKGPGLIIVHGAMETRRSHVELAEALSDSFTVYLPDRRGRGRSSSTPPGKVYKMEMEVEDMEALARETGARFIFGISSGALLTLRTSLDKPHLFQKVAVFEPPLCVPRDQFLPLRERFHREYDRGDPAAMLITGMKITGLGPFLFRTMPSWLVKPVINWGIQREKPKTEPGDEEDDVDDPPPLLRNLVPTMKGDLQIVVEMMDRPLDSFAALKDGGTHVLFLSGTASHKYLIYSCEVLEGVILGARHTRLPELHHLAAANRDVGGKPDMVAPVLNDFFGGQEDKAS